MCFISLLYAHKCTLFEFIPTVYLRCRTIPIHIVSRSLIGYNYSICASLTQLPPYRFETAFYTYLLALYNFDCAESRCCSEYVFHSVC